MASFVRRIARLRFETPLAAALGVSGAFATSVAPLHGAMPDVGRWLLASAALVVLPPIAWASMRPRRRRPAPEVAAEAGHEEEIVPVVRMRRADRHPDAPVPQPIRASRDLGTPFMAVADRPARTPEPARFEPIFNVPVEGAAAPADEPLELDMVVPEPVAAEADAPEPEVVEPETVVAETVEPETVEPETVAAETVEPETVEPEAIEPDLDVPEADDADEEPPVARNDSLAAMMERLSKGVERRGGVPPRRSAEAIARPVQPALRDALATLNRLADRR